jgi:hypothetical protein
VVGSRAHGFLDRSLKLLGLALVLIINLCSHATASPSTGGPSSFLAGPDSVDRSSVGFGYITAEYLSKSPSETLPSKTDPRLYAASRPVWLEVHTYFVAGKEGAPAVWVHNASWNKFQQATRGFFRGVGRGLGNHRARAAAAWEMAQEALGRGIGRVARPAVVDRDLGYIVGNLYHGAAHGGAMLGHGGTADAIRIELATGVRVFGKNHVRNSGPQLQSALRGWLRRSGPAASAADRATATALLGDLTNALGGR